MYPTRRFSTFLLKTALGLAGVGFSAASAKEGMWLPPTLKSREADMKNMGLDIPVEMLYNDNGTGLNNAVVLFGKGCTGEIISSKGLLLTNHHCGYGTVQGLSSKEKDYFAHGFWAMNMQQEIPCPGLTVTFIRKMENVTGNILGGLNDTLRESARDSIIAGRIKSLEKGYRFTSGLDATIKPYYNGNQYWVIITETFRDIRLVGFPSNGIGQFGGDTDNWMWPRHTGDFSMFRVYAGAGNKPADYNRNNKPYQAKQFFTINAGGYKEGDFTMVYGFPGITQEYISSNQLNQVYSIVDPIRIDARTKRLDVWTRHMQQDRDVFLKYTSKRAGVANGWKKWQGEVRGLELNNVVGRKRESERKFQSWAAADTALPYADNLLARIQANTGAADSLLKVNEYINEALMGVELVQQGAALDRLLQASMISDETTMRDSVKKLAATWNGFFKNYDAATDRDVFEVLMPLFFEKCPQYVPKELRDMLARHGGDYTQWATSVYRKSLAADEDRLDGWAQSADRESTGRIMGDPAWQIYQAVQKLRRERIAPVLSAYYERMGTLNRLYTKSQMEQGTRQLYPDANLTLRLTYGKVKGIDPDGPAGYSFQTNLDEAIAKDNPEVAEFTVPAKLKELYNRKNYGRWKAGNTVPLAFIADNHTSGGNSGSPVLNARGELIGTNFDRIWEGTMSDLYFDPNLCRNISVDIRYTLFIVEKFGGAGWLLKEMKIVNR